MSKKILVCFDGTGNEPKAAEQEVKDGVAEDDNISNVLKLHLLAGGNLENTEGPESSQISLYFPGVGTRSNFLVRTIRSAFASRGPEKIIKEVNEDLASVYEVGDELHIFGFSRGAAIARLFVSQISANGLNGNACPIIRFLGLWDTVEADGLPRIIRKGRPLSRHIDFNAMLAPEVVRAYHLVSIDETRLAFKPTLFNQDERISEIWFAGVHSDVGGGYRKDGLSDITLKFMMARAGEAGLGFYDLNELWEGKDLTAIDHRKEKVQIGLDDVEINPNHKDEIHYHDQRWRSWTVGDDTVADRKIEATIRERDGDEYVDEVIEDATIKIHGSVLDRIRDFPGYRPKNLKIDASNTIGINHEVVEDGEIQG